MCGIYHFVVDIATSNSMWIIIVDIASFVPTLMWDGGVIPTTVTYSTNTSIYYNCERSELSDKVNGSSVYILCHTYVHTFWSRGPP